MTGLLVRAPQSEWRKGSLIAVDAGSHLASIVRILQRDMPRVCEDIPPRGHSRTLDHGPFQDIKFPHISARANALHIFRELLHSVLITHPHLDHLSAIAINTPALEYGREAKAIFALPSTLDAIKQHIFNDFIWPNLSDEGHGAGFITYRRLIEGGNPRLGHGESRGYVSVCDGLTAKCWSVSHGKCRHRGHSISHQRGDSFGYGGNDYNFPSRRMSRISDDHGYFASMSHPPPHNHTYPGGPGSQAPTPGVHGSQAPAGVDGGQIFDAVTSSAFFIRNDETGQEVLIFGDTEPDTVSIAPRNHVVWDDAAPKVVAGLLKAVFIECSFDDSTRDEDLYGHLCPRHLVAELKFLAHCVSRVRRHNAVGTSAAEAAGEQGAPPDVSENNVSASEQEDFYRAKKRKRQVNGDLTSTPEASATEFTTPSSSQPSHSGYVGAGTRSASRGRRKVSHPAVQADTFKTPEVVPRSPIAGRRRSVQFAAPHHIDMNDTSGNPTASASTLGTNPNEKLQEPLKGLTVHIIHIKDTMMDGPQPGDIILSQLQTQAKDTGLGCEFDVTSWGESVWI